MLISPTTAIDPTIEQRRETSIATREAESHHLQRIRYGPNCENDVAERQQRAHESRDWDAGTEDIGCVAGAYHEEEVYCANDSWDIVYVCY